MWAGKQIHLSKGIGVSRWHRNHNGTQAEMPTAALDQWSQNYPYPQAAPRIQCESNILTIKAETPAARLKLSMHA